MADLTFNATFDSFTGKSRDAKINPHSGLHGYLYDPSAPPVTASAIAATPVAAPTPTPAPAPGRIDELIDRKNVLTEDVFSTLERDIPGSIRDYLADLRENLLDESARRPTAIPLAYNLSVRFCNSLIAAYDERMQAVARLHNDSASSAAGVATTTRLHPNWVDYLRERDQAAAASHNNTLQTAFARMNIVQWNQRAAQLRQNFDVLYSQLRAAARQPPGRSATAPVTTPQPAR